MSVGLAVTKIGQYSGLIDSTTEQINVLQQQIEAATLGGAQPPADLRAQLARKNVVLGLYKEFIDFWKQVLKDFLALIKSIGELAQGAR